METKTIQKINEQYFENINKTDSQRKHKKSGQKRKITNRYYRNTKDHNRTLLLEKN